MFLDDIKRVAVVGSGVMGSQIAQLLSQAGGYEVLLTSTGSQSVEKGLESIRGNLQNHFVAKGKMTDGQMQVIMARIRIAETMADAASNADFIIEAVYEKMDLKKFVFRQIDLAAPPQTIIVTSTSGLSITEIASATRRPDKICGMHFFYPVAVMKLVEVPRGALTSDETVAAVCAFAGKLGKEPVICRDTGYGFVANRAYWGMLDEAVQMVWERVASPADIDKALKLAYNLPLGPLELGDMIGRWPRFLSAEEDRIREMGEAKGRLHPLLRSMLRAGYTGGPGKKGLYDFWKDSLSKQ